MGLIFFPLFSPAVLYLVLWFTGLPLTLSDRQLGTLPYPGGGWN